MREMLKKGEKEKIKTVLRWLLLEIQRDKKRGIILKLKSTKILLMITKGKGNEKRWALLLCDHYINLWANVASML